MTDGRRVGLERLCGEGCAPYFEPKATKEKPYWYCPDVKFVAKFARFVPLEDLKTSDKLDGMLLTSGKASRLSVQPVEKKHFDAIVKMGS